jgi:hypothetical protein
LKIETQLPKRFNLITVNLITFGSITVGSITFGSITFGSITVGFSRRKQKHHPNQGFSPKLKGLKSRRESVIPFPMAKANGN